LSDEDLKLEIAGGLEYLLENQEPNSYSMNVWLRKVSWGTFSAINKIYVKSYYEKPKKTQIKNHFQ